MRTQAVLDRLVHELSHNCGDLLAASRMCGVSMQFVAAWRKDDKVADEAIREAERIGTYGLVSAAINRAIHGVKKDVYHKGHVVGQQTEYSDSLHLALLKAKVDDFKANGEGAPQVTVNVANIMPRASSYEEWLTMRDATTARSLPRPDNSNVVEAVFTEVPRAFAGISL